MLVDASFIACLIKRERSEGGGWKRPSCAACGQLKGEKTRRLKTQREKNRESHADAGTGRMSTERERHVSFWWGEVEEKLWKAAGKKKQKKKCLNADTKRGRSKQKRQEHTPQDRQQHQPNKGKTHTHRKKKGDLSAVKGGKCSRHSERKEGIQCRHRFFFERGYSWGGYEISHLQLHIAPAFYPASGSIHLPAQMCIRVFMRLLLLIFLPLWHIYIYINDMYA